MPVPVFDQRGFPLDDALAAKARAVLSDLAQEKPKTCRAVVGVSVTDENWVVLYTRERDASEPTELRELASDHGFEGGFLTDLSGEMSEGVRRAVGYDLPY